MVLKVSNFLEYPGNERVEPEANCQDLSNLFQVCAAALGAPSFEVQRIDGPFISRPILPLGPNDWFTDYEVIFHQVGISVEAGSLFDPTYQLDNGGQPQLPINMKPADYRLLLQDSRRKPNQWKVQTPVRPLEVK